MNKQELLATVLEKATVKDPSVSKGNVGIIIDEMITAMSDALKKGESISIRNFGTFEVTNAPARVARNPKTGDTISVPAKKKAKFRPAGTLHEFIQ